MSDLQRSFGRTPQEIRPFSFCVGTAPNAQGSALVTFGDTKVLCTVSVDREVPRHRLEKGQGWLTAEYGMLPCATSTRNSREQMLNNGRTKEIQRLIGRSLRACVDLNALQGFRFIVDCDVLQADGSTRTSSICGAWLAVVHACAKLRASGELNAKPITQQIAAISVGIYNDTVIADLDYSEDSRAQVDSNIVMNEKGEFIEVQGTAEGHPFTEKQLLTMLGYARQAIESIMEQQREALLDEDIDLRDVLA